MRDGLRLARRFWREALLGLLRALPWLVLIGLGLLWLYQTGWLLVWAAGGAMLALAAWPLRRAIRRRAKSRAADLLATDALPDGEITSRERQARAVVHRLAVSAGADDITSQAAATALMQRTVRAVADVFHPGYDRAWARFTLIEALALTEEVARGMREGAARTIPGSDVVRLDLVLWGADLVERHGGAGRIALKVLDLGRRAVRFVKNPAHGVAAEVQRSLDGSSDGAMTTLARAALAQLLVRETGRVAIRLYAGRLTEGADLDAARTAPVRLLLAGQRGAGKSALGDALRAVLGGGDVRISGASGAPFEILEGPALDGSAASLARLRDMMPPADLVIWVAAATQPARAPDAAALAAVRKEGAPPMLLAVSRCDQLSPVREWTPPYDLRGPKPGSKAATIRAALDAVAADLGIPIEHAVPIALPPGAAAYNVDALLAAMREALPDARQRQIDRAMAARGFPWERVLSQAAAGGRALLRSGARAASDAV